LLFASNLGLIFKLLQTRDSANETANTREGKGVLTVVLDQVVCSVRERYSDPNLSLKVLSQGLNLSERHLGRLVREVLGQTFRQHLRSQRISEAARLLADTADGVKMIAGRVGYCDPSHFCRDFRMLMGCTPLKFRSRKDRKPMSDLLYRKSAFSY
jgi:AraC-like DNA-binding protein